jgi:hypothetical protein
MKRMHLIILFVGVALLVIGSLVVRHGIRTAVTVRPISDLPTPPAARPMDALQSGLKLDRRTDYTTDPAATKRLMEKLRQEELRQRPQEARN